jgi:tetratricopeptide (TPR) repeat protein
MWYVGLEASAARQEGSLVTTDALYEKATDAVERENFDYAIELLYQMIAQDPKNVKARQTLWLAERRKCAQASPSRMTVFSKGTGPWLASAAHALIGKPLKVIEDCERYLKVNPMSATIRNKLAQAAYAAGDIETAIAAYESARDVDAKNINALRQLGRLYKERFDATHTRRDMELAMNRFEELLKIRGTDHEAKSTAQWMAAQRAIEDGGWDDTETFRDKVRDGEGQADLQRDERLMHSEDEVEKEIKRLQDAVIAEPNRSNLYARMGDLLLQKKRFKQAEENFKKAYELERTNTFWRGRLGEVKIQFMKTSVDQFREKLEKTPTDAKTRQELDELTRKLEVFMVQEYKQRVAEQPTNMEVHYQLGMLLYERGDHDGAMQVLQKSVADPRYRMSSNHVLGLCLVGKKMYDRAVNMFTRAVEGAVVMNPLVKSVWYDLGDTYEKIGDYEQAEHAFGKIYDADVAFRDVRQRMEAVYKKAREKKG